MSRSAAEEKLVEALNLGYEKLSSIKADFQTKSSSNTFDSVGDNQKYKDWLNQWGAVVKQTLDDIFPTSLEWNKFLNPPVPGLRTTSVDAGFTSTTYRLSDLLGQLRIIYEQDLNRYTDLPSRVRLYVQEIDSFSKVRDVNVSEIQRFLKPGGYLDWSENDVQKGIEAIISEPFHKNDWGGETNDLYSSEIRINGRRTATAFLLKGNGLSKKTMEIADCGKNGDQILRLFRSPAELFVVQFVGNVSESVISDVEGKVSECRGQGREARYCVVNGQDLACVLYAYGKLR